MPRSEDSSRRIDWRGWLMLAWVFWFGGLYAKMVVERRGAKFRAIVGASSKDSGIKSDRRPDTSPGPRG